MLLSERRYLSIFHNVQEHNQLGCVYQRIGAIFFYFFSNSRPVRRLFVRFILCKAHKEEKQMKRNKFCSQLKEVKVEW
jgi:hypothetical protein